VFFFFLIVKAFIILLRINLFQKNWIIAENARRYVKAIFITDEAISHSALVPSHCRSSMTP